MKIYITATSVRTKGALSEAQRWDKLVKLICKNEETLCATLTEQQKATLDKLKDCQNELSGLTERDAFMNGFILAVRIMVEVMEGLGTVEEI